MSQVAIRSRLVTALSDWASAKVPAIPLAREGDSKFIIPASNGTYIEVFVIPANTLNPTVEGTRKRYMGEVVCNIHTKDGVGTCESETLAEEIAALFPVVPKIYLPVSVETTPSIKRSVVESSGMRVTPVCFMYRMEA